MNSNLTKEQLLQQYKEMRMYYFNKFEENMEKFDKHYKDHILYESVVKHFDKSFTQINQIAKLEIDNYLNNLH